MRPEELIPYREYEIAVRYAKALYLVAGQKKEISEIETELRLFLSILKKQKDLEKILNHPTVGVEAKERLLNVIFAEGWLSKEAVRFIFLLIEKKRLPILNYIIAVYHDFVFMKERKVKVHLQSAHRLKEEEKESLRRKLSKILDKLVEFEVDVEPSLIGGLRIKAGSTLYDGSVKRRLELIREELL